MNLRGIFRYYQVHLWHKVMSFSGYKQNFTEAKHVMLLNCFKTIVEIVKYLP